MQLLNLIESVNIRGDGNTNMAFSLCVFVVNSLVRTHREQSHFWNFKYQSQIKRKIYGSLFSHVVGSIAVKFSARQEAVPREVNARCGQQQPVRCFGPHFTPPAYHWSQLDTKFFLMGYGIAAALNILILIVSSPVIFQISIET